VHEARIACIDGAVQVQERRIEVARLARKQRELHCRRVLR
jgi:hypothetical protein